MQYTYTATITAVKLALFRLKIVISSIGCHPGVFFFFRFRNARVTAYTTVILFLFLLKTYIVGTHLEMPHTHNRSLHVSLTLLLTMNRK